MSLEDAINVDDSDLPSLFNRPTTSNSPSRPSLHPCSNLLRPSQTLVPTPAPRPPPAQTSPSFRPIPGPAGAFQFALHRKSAMLAHPSWRTSPLATNDLIADTEEDDSDFKLGSASSSCSFSDWGRIRLSQCRSAQLRLVAVQRSRYLRLEYRV